MRSIVIPQERPFQLLIVGGGPGGMATLLAAHHGGKLDDLLDQGVAVIEQGTAMGGGALGQYAINSDSSGLTFVDCLRSIVQTPLTSLYNHPLTRRLAAAGDGAVTLEDAGMFLDLVGSTLQDMVASHDRCQVLVRHAAISVARTDDGWSVKVRDADGSIRILYARNVVLATGADQPVSRLDAEQVGGARLVELCGEKLLQSGDVLSKGGLAAVAARLDGVDAPRVTVVGGSTSAVAVCHALLNRMPGVRFGRDGVALVHRRNLPIYYPDAQGALDENYTEFGPDDICGISGKVFRFAGFRLDSRELVMQARGIGNRPPEPRLYLHRLVSGADEKALELLRSAHVVIAALGYRPRGLTIYNDRYETIPLLAHTGPQQPMVDDQCRVLSADGKVLPGLFGIGLAAGFVPRGPLGGEASFRGQANGLWLWQKDVGGLIVNAVCGARPRSRGTHPSFDFPAGYDTAYVTEPPMPLHQDIAANSQRPGL
ncbi:MAG: FAD-dependent oxidoreductase [Acetobacter sp.]